MKKKNTNPDGTKKIYTIIRVDDALTQAQQKRQTTTAILSMAHRSSMDIYSTRTTNEHGNVTPDIEGWLFKQGCKYKKWNKRWFVLKGPNLFYFKSPKVSTKNFFLLISASLFFQKMLTDK